MNKIQKILKFINSEIGFFSITFIVIVLLFLVLNPKISNQLFFFKSEATLNNFISSTKSRGLIDPQEYWKFREFYSPGFFNFSKNGVDASHLNKAKEIIGISFNEKTAFGAFLIFSSPKLNSIDMFTKETEISRVFDIPKKSDLIFINKNSVIYKSDSKTIKIIFLLSNQDMRKANGFFDYQDKDKQITEGRNWFNITSLTTD